MNGFRTYVGRDAVCTYSQASMKGIYCRSTQRGSERQVFLLRGFQFHSLVPVTRTYPRTKAADPNLTITPPMSMDTGKCTVEEQALFRNTSGTAIVCLTRGDSIGLTLVAESGFISLIAVLGVFMVIFVSINEFMTFSKLTSAILRIVQGFSKGPVNRASETHIYSELMIYSRYGRQSE